MKKSFYTLIILLALCFGFNISQVDAQCTEIATPGPFTDYNNAFGGAPCNDGSGCPFNELDIFEVFAAEAYSISNFVAGSQYQVSVCNGPGAGSWVPDFTIVAPSGAIDAFGLDAGESCTLTFTASETGEYIVLINEADQCGGGPNVGVGNGFLALTCMGDVPCPAAVACEAGTLITAGMACVVENSFDLNAINSVIPDAGEYTWAFSDQLGGTGGVAGGFSITGAQPSVSYDSDINGVLSANNLPILSGVWVIFGEVSDGNVICSTTLDSLIVNFDLEGPSIDSLVQTGADELTVSVSGGVEPYTYLWNDVDAQTTPTATGLDNTSSFFVIITDANGCQVSQVFDFDPEIIVCTPGTLTTTGEVSICDVAGTFDLVIENDTIPDGGSFAWAVSDELGGTGGLAGGFNLTNSNPISTFDSDANGVLSSNNLPPLSGPWVWRGLVLDANGDVCAQTDDSLIVNFGTESPTVTSIDFDGVDALTANATGGVAPYEYLWDDANAQTTQTAVGLVDGVYTVIISDANGCFTSEEAIINLSSINSISSLQDLSIVPNPSTGLFSVTLALDQSELVAVEVLDISGRMIQSQQRTASTDRFEFNLIDAAPGMYFVRIIVGDESLTQKIIVNK